MSATPGSWGALFVGRERELAQTAAALALGPVVWHGPPGVGKTTLIRAFAARCSGAVLDAGADLAVALGVAATPDADLGRALAARGPVLVLLDDLGAATPLEDWARAAPEARLLGAARVRPPSFGIPLPPLLPADAEALYLARARAIAPDVAIDPVALQTLLRALDHLPLAITLAAARVRLFPPGHPQLPGLLAPLSQAIALSVGALPAGTREALSACAAFQGAFDVGAFVRVTGGTPEDLEALLDASLVALTGPGRVTLLATVRGWLTEQGVPAEARARHAEWALDAGRESLDALRGGDAGPLAAMRADLAAVDDVRAALILGELALARGPLTDPLRGREIPAAHRARAAHLRSRLAGRLLRHEEGLGALADVVTEDRGLAVRLAAERVFHLTRLHRLDEAERALAAMRALPADDPEAIGEARRAEGQLHYRANRMPEAVAALEDGLAALRLTPSPELEARLEATLGAVLRTHDPRRSVTVLQRALARYEALGDLRWQGIVAQWLGLRAMDAGALDEASALLLRSAEACARAGDGAFEANAWVYLSIVRIEQGDGPAAEAALARVADRTVAPLQRASVRAHEALLHHVEGRLELAIAGYGVALDRFTELGQPALAASWRPFRILAMRTAGADPGLDVARLREEAARLGGDYPLFLQVLDDPENAPLAREAASRRSDFRLLLGLAAAPVVAPDGQWFQRPGSPRTAIGNRPQLCQFLAILAEKPGVPVHRDVLLARLWPGQKLVGKSGDARLHVATGTLRKLGAPVVTTAIDGELAYSLERGSRVAAF